ncbi:MAG: fructose-bisphosphate aldolase [Desulfovibrio sp.]|nr:MAG: fructose-bisphosphate aldolase [Desulfovibrio sp.]
MIGSLRKLQRFFDPASERSLVLALDHGAAEGMAPGIVERAALIEALSECRVQGVALNKGAARSMATRIPAESNLVLQLSGGTRHGLPPYNRAIVCSVPEALRFGADGVAVQVNIGNDLEDRMLSDLGAVTEEAHQFGLPVLVSIYAVGGQIVNEFDPSLIAHSIILGGEMGADLICVPYSGEPESFSLAIASCPMPVLVTGGPRQPDWSGFLTLTREALDCGAAGVFVGRNVVQHEDPLSALKELAGLVHAKE